MHSVWESPPVHIGTGVCSRTHLVCFQGCVGTATGRMDPHPSRDDLRPYYSRAASDVHWRTRHLDPHNILNATCQIETDPGHDGRVGHPISIDNRRHTAHPRYLYLVSSELKPNNRAPRSGDRSHRGRYRVSMFIRFVGSLSNGICSIHSHNVRFAV